MAIDASIYQNLRPVQTPDVADTMQKAMTLRQLAYQNQQQDYAMQKQQALRDAYAKNMNPDGTLNEKGAISDYSQIDPMGGIALGKSLNEMAEQRAKTTSAQADSIQKVVGVAMPHMEYLAGLPDGQRAQAYPSVMKLLESKGVPMDNVPHDANGNAVYDPQHFAQSYATLKNSDQYLKQEGERANIGNTYANTRKANADANKTISETFEKDPSIIAKVNGQVDPATLVPHLVPKEHQAKAFAEIEAAQNTKKNADAILDSFQKAADNKGFVDLIPGAQNRYQKSLHALLGPTFKDVEGTVRQAAMDNLFANITPQTGDSADTIKEKQKALVGYLQSKSSAPVSLGYKIDLKNYDSTSPFQVAKKDPSKDKKSIFSGSEANAGDETPPTPPLHGKNSIVTIKGTHYKVVDDKGTVEPMQGNK